jgi:hypothetical protein
MAMPKHNDGTASSAVKKKATAKERGDAVKRIQKLGRGLSLGGLKIKNLIRAGRR